MSQQRIAVRYANKSLMPMKQSRIRKYVDNGWGVISYDAQLKVHYLNLLVLPTGFELQPELDLNPKF